MKQYDQSYFDRWYRGRGRVHDDSDVRQKVSLAVATTEYFIRRPIRSVLDIGCGEGAWHEHLRVLRPRVHYQGLDPSDYAVERFGKSRNIRQASLRDLPSLDLRDQYDLVVCSDVLHYVGDHEIRAAIEDIVRLTGGVAFLEVLTKDDDIIGDMEGFLRRPAKWYRSLFQEAGLTAIGPYSWLAPALLSEAAEMEAQR
jgi:SAM-dependent methyltransferase